MLLALAFTALLGAGHPTCVALEDQIMQTYASPIKGGIDEVCYTNEDNEYVAEMCEEYENTCAALAGNGGH